MKHADELLREAADVIAQRGKLRDKAGGERSMARAVESFNALVGGDKRLTELEGWLFMCCLKMARATAGRNHLDDFTDLAGYAALAGECITREEAEPADAKSEDPYFGALPTVRVVTTEGELRAYEAGRKEGLLEGEIRGFHRARPNG